MINVIDTGMRVVALLVSCALFLGIWWFSSRSNIGLALELLYIGSLIGYVVLPRRYLRQNKYTFYCILLLLVSGVAAILSNHIASATQHIFLDNIPLMILLSVQAILIVMTFALRKSQQV